MASKLHLSLAFVAFLATVVAGEAVPSVHTDMVTRSSRASMNVLQRWSGATPHVSATASALAKRGRTLEEEGEEEDEGE